MQHLALVTFAFTPINLIAPNYIINEKLDPWC